MRAPLALALVALLAAPATPAGAAPPFEEGALGRAIAALRAIRGTRELRVERDGRPVFHRAWDGRAGRPRPVKSASKSLLGALVGIALAEGRLTSIDQPVVELLPGLPEDPRRRAITLRHLLTMTTGLASTSGPAYGRWVSSRDWLRAAFLQPVEAPPGARFTYSTGNTHLLSAILTRATGMPTREYARRALLAPIGAGVAAWARDPAGIDIGGNEVTMTAGDLAALGRLYLEEGRRGDRQVVPQAWVAESTRVHAEGWPDRYGAYGYLWWIPRPGAFMAVGYGGQFCYVAPSQGVVIVLLSTLDGKGAPWDRRVLARFADIVAAAS